MTKKRLDVLVVERGLAESRARAQWLIRNGCVLVEGKPCRQPGRSVPEAISVEITAKLPYVSQGGLKLAHALDTFHIAVTDLVALDVGASTGGFTDCLLQRGARQVYAVDVGRGQLHSHLQADTRVVSLEETDIRELETLPNGTLVDLAVVDVSFISLRLVLPAVLRLLHPEGEIVALIKPQYEAGPEAVSRRGVVREREDRQRAVQQVLESAQGLGLGLAGLCSAPQGEPRGNVEFLVHLRRGKPGPGLEAVIASLS